jgi:tetratricopeptide (TPR) repeat protein
MFDYLMAGQFVVNTDPSKAATLMKRAIEIGLQKQQERNEFYFVIIAYITSKLFGEKIDISLSYEQRVHDLGSAYVTLGGALLLQKKDDEAGEVYEKAIQLYNDSNLTMAFKQYSISIIYKFWADSEAVAFLDCNSYLAHLQKAAEYFPEERKIATNLDWSSIQYELSYTSTYCASDGRLHPPVLPVSNFVEGITSNALLNWSSSNNQPTWPDGNNTGVQNSKSPSEKR